MLCTFYYDVVTAVCQLLINEYVMLSTIFLHFSRRKIREVFVFDIVPLSCDEIFKFSDVGILVVMDTSLAKHIVLLLLVAGFSLKELSMYGIICRRTL